MDDDEHYLFISADTHAHPTDDVYRAYLDPAFREAFNESIGAPASVDTAAPPVSDEARNDIQNAQGCVGEVVFPDASPPFFPRGVLMSGPPRPAEYAQRRAGVHALNRWMAEFCAFFPVRRAGVGSVVLNDLDDTLTDVAWIAEHGLRGGVQLPNITPDVDWIPHLGDRCYDRLWAAIQDADLTVNMHVEGGFPPLDPDAASLVRFNTDAPHNMIRNVVLMTLGGVFDRFPRLRVAVSEVPIGVLTSLVGFLDVSYETWRRSGQLGTIPLTDEIALRHAPGDYLATNVWFTASPPLVADLATVEATLGFDHLMVGNDYPHPESAYPFTREVLRQVFCDWEPTAVRTVLCDTPAALYGFDIEVLRAEADRFGPTVAEIAEPLSALPENANFTLAANA